MLARRTKVIGVFHRGDAHSRLTRELNRPIHRQASGNLTKAVLSTASKDKAPLPVGSK